MNLNFKPKTRDQTRSPYPNSNSDYLDQNIVLKMKQIKKNIAEQGHQPAGMQVDNDYEQREISTAKPTVRHYVETA